MAISNIWDYYQQARNLLPTQNTAPNLVSLTSLSPTQAPAPAPAPSPYEEFVTQNAPKTDGAATNLATGLMSGYQQLPPETIAQLGQATTKLANYTPEKINVGQAQTMPLEYYQKQIEDLSAPLTSQYDLARKTMRGDQAARGTLYDSEGYSDIVNELDKPYFDQLGNITRGVQIKRMEDMRANQQDYLTRLLDEAKDRRSLSLDATKSGADILTRTALQKMGIDANTINSLLGYNADRYGTEANLFGNIYSADTDYNKAELQQGNDRGDNILRLLEMSGYTEQPQGQLWESYLEELGFKMNDLVPPDPEYAINNQPNVVPTYGTYAYGKDGTTLYRGTENGWEEA
jgi:hypothetical protein